MRNRIHIPATLLLMAITAMAQVPAAKTKQAPAAKTKEWKTPWGDPDLQGSWSNATTTPLERPAKYNGREFLTEQERAAQDRESTIATDKRDKPGTPQDVNGAYNGFWWDRGLSDGRTSLIVDPPDGRIPPLTPEGKKRKADLARLGQNAEGEPGAGPYNGPEDVELYTRCIIRAALPRVPTGYDNLYEIVQTPGYVAILQEQMHETRVIPLDGRPHLDGGIRQWLGDSRGHWEGNTLVVETTNFTDQASFEGSGKNMRLVERWTRVADKRIDYRFTVEDPATWIRPWTAAIAWNQSGPLYEYACHEDNYGLYGILSGARAQDQKDAAHPGK
jgi:hypothetical protein